MPKSSNSNCVFSSPRAVGAEAFTPNLVCRTPANVLPSSPYCLSYDGSFDTRIVSYQSGWIWVKFWPKSSMAKP